MHKISSKKNFPSGCDESSFYHRIFLNRPSIVRVAHAKEQLRIRIFYSSSNCIEKMTHAVVSVVSYRYRCTPHVKIK